MIKLIDANEKYLKEYKIAYEKSVEKVKQGVIKKHDLMFVNIDEVDIIQKCKDNRIREKLPKGYVPSYDYFFVDDDKFIGILHIRIELTTSLLKFGGNIGYGINPTYWHKGYGTKILELGLEKARELGLSNKVLITCNDDNIGSYKIIEKNGGVLENKIEHEIDNEIYLIRRYWIAL